MRAVQFDAYGPPEQLHLAEVETPTPGEAEVRVRVAAVGVNPADPKWRQGMFQSFAPLTFPHVPGYDLAGVVDAVGPGVSRPKVGDRVVGMIPKGAYAEYAIVPAAQATQIPDGLDFATAAALPTAGLTGVQMIEEQIRPSAGQTVLITGATGAVGRFAAYAARRLGVRVIAAVRATQRSEARAIGAAETIVLGEEDWMGPPFDHVADTVGGPDVAKLCRRMAPGGRISTAATTPIDPQGLPAAPVFIVVHGDPPRLAALAEAVVRGELVVPIARRLPLGQAAQAQRLTEVGGLGGKVILEP